MSLHALFYLVIVFIGWVASIFLNPLWGLLTYAFVYFNIPQCQWWGYQVPDIRWSLTSAMILVISSLLHYQSLSKIKLISIKSLKWLIALLILMIIISPSSPCPETWRRVYDFFRYVAIFILIVKIIKDYQGYKYFIWLFLGEILYLSYLAHYYFRGGRLDGIGTPDATNANMFAALLLTSIPLLGNLILYGKKVEKIGVLLSIPVIIDAFIMCASRGAFIGLVCMLIAMIITADKKVRKYMMIIAVIIAISLYFLIDETYKRRLATLFHTDSIASAKEVSSGRFEIWQYGLKMLKDYPFGTGGGGFMYLSPIYLPKRLIESTVGQRASHNTYLMVLIEQGPLGLVLFLGFLLSIFKSLHKIKQKVLFLEDKKHLYYESLAIQSSLIGLLTASFFIDRLYFEVLYWLCALAVVVEYLSKTTD